MIKFHMIAEIAELEGARRLLDKELARAAAEGVKPPRSFKLGVMLEVPSLLWQLPALLRRIDFLSIGTNDLAQFLFACDRGNPRLAERYDLLSAPMVALAARTEMRAESTASRIRPSGQAGSGSAASYQRSHAICTRPLFSASYSAPCPRRCPGTSDSSASTRTGPPAHSTASASSASSSARRVKHRYSSRRNAASRSRARSSAGGGSTSSSSHAILNATATALVFKFFGRNPKIIMRWPHHVKNDGQRG